MSDGRKRVRVSSHGQVNELSSQNKVCVTSSPVSALDRAPNCPNSKFDIKILQLDRKYQSLENIYIYIRKALIFLIKQTMLHE